MSDVVPIRGEPGPCTCERPDPVPLNVWAAIQCGNCNNVIAPMTVSEGGERVYSLNEVARLFHTNPGAIKLRAMNGDFPYKVNARGNFEFSRESLLAHLDELSKRNNRLG